MESIFLSIVVGVGLRGEVKGSSILTYNQRGYWIMLIPIES
jgi:hypothetical protein